MFTGELRAAQWRSQAGRLWAPTAVALIAAVLIGLQITASGSGFVGPLRSLAGDYFGTPTSATVPWVSLGVAMVGLSRHYRLWSLSLAAALDVVFAAVRLARGGAWTLGNGPLIVLTGLAVIVAWRRWAREEHGTALRGVAFGLLLIIATKVGDSWLRITAILRPVVMDEYALLADHALAQPSWLLGRLLHAGGPVLNAAFHWVYIELPVAAMVVAIYQLRNVSIGGWPRHFLIPTFLVLGLIGPLIYVFFPLVGPDFAFGSAGRGFEVGDFWPHSVPRINLSPRAIAFDGSTPRNCMPSMHTAWALAVFLHSRGGPRWLRIGGALWLVCTVAATLGFGYHYGVDLLAGGVLCLTVESALREPVRDRVWWRIGMTGFGAAFLAALLVCCRYFAADMARFSVPFGVLIVGTLAAFSAAFYVTYFARQAAPADDRSLPVRGVFVGQGSSAVS
ncbi:DUF5933 domain-containing protein [Mycobacterium sp. TY814]|uniref:DUF5933 domain-containing protein n=1 Tax=unclassified Mycobacterium TaxID=2642494 RepID=UPI0027411869|nr:DUF5933 domain-containing protein [Mycobacterium sp. TY814]MDP7721946.1 DUF5933 domain-containing protein [Mycobacterium sp. TY814]